MSQSQPTRVGVTEFAEFNGNTWKRRVGTDKWIQVDSTPSQLEVSPVCLMLVRENQSEGEPDHWLLFVAREGQRGTVYQVTGDATCMAYCHAEDENVVSSECFKDSYILAHLDQYKAERVRFYANSEPAPQAPDRRSVKENCQGWTVRVIERLVEEGIVEKRRLDNVRKLQQPV